MTTLNLRKRADKADIVGFYWLDENDLTFRVAILDRTRKVRNWTDRRIVNTYCEEFSAQTPAGLCRAARREGYVLGKAAEVRTLCETAPRSIGALRRRPRKAKP